MASPTCWSALHPDNWPMRSGIYAGQQKTLKDQEQQDTGLETWIGILLFHCKVSTWERQCGTWLVHMSSSVFNACIWLDDIDKALCHLVSSGCYTSCAQRICHTWLKAWSELVLDAGYVQSWSPSFIAPYLNSDQSCTTWNNPVWGSKDHCLQLLEILTSSLLWTSSHAFRLLSLFKMNSVTVIKCLNQLFTLCAIQVMFIQTVVHLCHKKLRTILHNGE